MISSPEPQQEVTALINRYIVYTFASLIDGVFMILWVGIQWGVNYVTSVFQLNQVDLITFRIFQGLFALTTLAPVVMQSYEDLSIMLIQARKRIDREQKK